MFVKKLNKKTDGSIYVIEEDHIVTEGKYENHLQHDNANIHTIRVYTGPRLSGDEIANVIVSKPTETPWKTLIKVFTSAERIYITYETPGDTVEADDINLLQEFAEQIQEDFDLYKSSGHINGGTF